MKTNNALTWLKEHVTGKDLMFDIDSINGNVTIIGDVIIIDPDLTCLEYPIYRVNGNFTWAGNVLNKVYTKLNTLKNFPKIVDGEFNISMNPDLLTLKGGPVKVNGNYKCSHCALKNLDGVAPNIEGSLIAYANPLMDITALENTDVKYYVDLDYTPVLEDADNQIIRNIREKGKLFKR